MQRHYHMSSYAYFENSRDMLEITSLPLNKDSFPNCLQRVNIPKSSSKVSKAIMTSIDFKKLLNCKQSSVANPARVGGFSGMDAPSKTLRFYYIHALKKCSFKQPPRPPTLPEEKLSL